VFDYENCQEIGEFNHWKYVGTSAQQKEEAKEKGMKRHPASTSLLESLPYGR